jgi:hypothetical protein
VAALTYERPDGGALVQNVEPDNPTYQRHAETILTGFEVLPLQATAP